MDCGSHPKRFRWPRTSSAGWCLLLVSLVLPSDLRSIAGSPLLIPPGSVVREISIPIYATAATSPSVLLRARQLRSEYQRRGFFRVALLPQVVAEDVSIEFLQSPTLELLQQVSRHLRGGIGRKGLLIHRIRIGVSGNSVATLSANSLQSTGEDVWEFSGEGLVTKQDVRQAFSRAQLWLSGPKAGHLEWKDHSGAHDLEWLPARGSPTLSISTPSSQP